MAGKNLKDPCLKLLDKKNLCATLKLDMKKTARLFLITTSFIFAGFVSLLPCFTLNTYAQEEAPPAEAPEGAMSNQSWQCLDADWQREKGMGFTHTVILAAKNFNQFSPPGTDVYIVECLSTKTGDKCTTGDETADLILFGNNNDLNELKTKYNYKVDQFTGTQPTKSDLNGKIGPITWKSDLKIDSDHTFFGVSLIPETTLSLEQAPGLKLGTFYFQNASEDCVSFRWDPYGRVFDSQSLEPIANTSVTLYSKEGNSVIKVSLPGVTNPQITRSDGIFNFVVPDGTYTLKPVRNSHSFPNLASKLNPNFYKAYYDIYRGEDIIQAGKMEHRDIPVDPVGAPYQAPVEILDYSTTLNKLSSKTIISGAVSHPLSRIKVSNGKTYLKQITASRFGRFNITLDSAKINSAEKITLEAVKIDLSVSSPTTIPATQEPESQPTKEISSSSVEKIWGKLKKYLLPFIYAQETAVSSVSIEPILNNLEGYAYNNARQPVPFATISVFIRSSQKPFCQTKADEKGYFNIPSQYLPPLAYFIQVKSPNGEINDLTTSQFGYLNKRFAAKYSVNYGTYRPVAYTPTYQNTSTGLAIGGQSPASLLPTDHPDYRPPTDSSLLPTDHPDYRPPGYDYEDELYREDEDYGKDYDADFQATGGKISKEEQAKQVKKKAFNIAIIILFLVLLGGAFYLYLKKRKEKESNV
jgi:hypothetical protein